MKPNLSFFPRKFIMWCASLFCVITAQAQTVTTSSDELDTPAGAAVSLREAIRDAASGQTVSFAAGMAGQVCVLIRGEISISGKTLTVNAAALAGGVTVDAMEGSRIFNVAAGAGLTLRNLTLQRGAAPESGSGGAVRSAGTLTLEDCAVLDSTAGTGAPGTNGSSSSSLFPPPGLGGVGGTGGSGGALSSTGTLTALRCRFHRNTAGRGGYGGSGGNLLSGQYSNGACGGSGGAGGAGGAISSTGAVTLTGCLFENNTSGSGGYPGNTGSGGGGFDTYCTPMDPFTHPRGGGSGAGGALQHSGTTLTVSACTFLANNVPGGTAYIYGYGGGCGNGGAVSITAGATVMTNCTLTGNTTGDGYGHLFTTPQPGDVGGNGAGIAFSGASLRLVHCTLTANHCSPGLYHDVYAAQGIGGGIFATAAVTADNCLIGGNKNTHVIDANAQILESNHAGAGIIAWTPATPFPNAPATAVAPQLGPVVLRGGAAVHVPLAGSPALNAGATIAGAAATDQSALPRAVGTPDLGAVELQGAEPATVKPQTLAFDPPITRVAGTGAITLTASASSGLAPAFTLVSGPATLTGASLNITGRGLVIVSATQPGNAGWAAAAPVLRAILGTGITQSIDFTPPASYYRYRGQPTVVTLPASTSAGLPITWSLPAGTSAAVAVISGNTLTWNGNTAARVLTGTNAGDATRDPVTIQRTLACATGTISITAVGGFAPFLDEAPFLSGIVAVAAQIPAPHTADLSFAAAISAQLEVIPPGAVWQPLPGAVSTPQIYAGQTYAVVYIKAADDSLIEGDHTGTITPETGPALSFSITDNDHPLATADAPPVVVPGAPMGIQVRYAVPAGNAQQPLGTAVFSFSLEAVSGATGSRSVTPASAGPFNAAALSAPTNITLPANLPHGSVWKLWVQSSAYPSAQTCDAGPVLTIVQPGDADRDGHDNRTEAALQMNTSGTDAPPLVLERQPGGALRAVLARRPVDLRGWQVVMQKSTNLSSWTAVPAGDLTVTPAGAEFERVEAALPGTDTKNYLRLLITPP